MHPAFFWIVPLIPAVIASYISVPALVRGLRVQAPFEYSVLGSPDKDDLFARLPNEVQLRFLWFVLRGEAFAVTHGATRVSAVVAWLGYVVTAISFVGFLAQRATLPG